MPTHLKSPRRRSRQRCRRQSCSASTVTGRPCQNCAVDGDTRCSVHIRQQLRKSVDASNQIDLQRTCLETNDLINHMSTIFKRNISATEVMLVHLLTRRGYAKTNEMQALPIQYQRLIDLFKFRNNVPDADKRCSRWGFVPWYKESGKIYESAMEDSVPHPSAKTPLVFATILDKQECRLVATALFAFAEDALSTRRLILEYICARKGNGSRFMKHLVDHEKGALWQLIFPIYDSFQRASVPICIRAIELLDDSGKPEFYLKLGFKRVRGFTAGALYNYDDRLKFPDDGGPFGFEGDYTPNGGIMRDTKKLDVYRLSHTVRKK